jgi:channel protein (hemolysin III family)
VSSLSHLVGAAVALLAACRSFGSHAAAGIAFPPSRFTCSPCSLAISGVYHSLDRGCSARSFMQHMDHFAIWLLIAGTFTAIHGVMFTGLRRRGALTLIWSCVAVGILLQVLWFSVFSGLPGLLLYLFLDWGGLFSIIKSGRQIGFRAVRPIWYAGITYSAGALLEATGTPVIFRRLVGRHEIFHVTVICGVILHWVFIRRLLIAHAPPLPKPAILSVLPATAA